MIWAVNMVQRINTCAAINLKTSAASPSRASSVARRTKLASLLVSGNSLQPAVAKRRSPNDLANCVDREHPEQRAHGALNLRGNQLDADARRALKAARGAKAAKISTCH